MKFRAALCFILFLSGMLLNACNMPQSQEAISAVNQVGGIQAWIDAPLDGSTIPFAPYEIVLHAYDPAGVTQVELSANGNLLAALPNLNPGQLLATLNYPWSPAAPGNYTLSARAQSSDGAWGSQTVAVVTVSDFTETPTFTPTATETLTPIATTFTNTPTSTLTLTPTSTFTPTMTFTPTTVPAELSFTLQVSTSQFYYGSCTPDQVTIQVFVSGGNITSVVIFKQLEDQASGTKTGWDQGSAMTPSGNGWFTRTVTARSVDGADSISSAWLLYQFAATGSAGQVVGRSQVYRDITLTACSAPPPPPARIITITPTTVPLVPIVPPIIIRRNTPTLIPPPK
jgi:hypothetical protein